MNSIKNTTAKNIVLANFHQKAFYSREYRAWWLSGRLYSQKNLPYENNFNYLMSVVEQIESLGYKVKICRSRCQICKDNNLENFFIDEKQSSKISSVFEACYKFVIHYNVTCHVCNGRDMFQAEDIEKTIIYCKQCGKTVKTSKPQ